MATVRMLHGWAIHQPGESPTSPSPRKWNSRKTGEELELLLKDGWQKRGRACWVRRSGAICQSRVSEAEKLWHITRDLYQNRLMTHASPTKTKTKKKESGEQKYLDGSTEMANSSSVSSPTSPESVVHWCLKLSPELFFFFFFLPGVQIQQFSRHQPGSWVSKEKNV